MTSREMKFNNFACRYAEELKVAFTKTIYDVVFNEQLFAAFDKIRRCRGTVWLIGNGGSAALASHMATDLQLGGVRAMALTDVAAITTIGNDERFQDVFTSQLARLAKKGDVLIAISGSGTSPNIVEATHWACDNGLDVIGMAGFKGGTMKTHTLLHVKADEMGIAQDLEQILLHIISYYLISLVRGES